MNGSEVNPVATMSFEVLITVADALVSVLSVTVNVQPELPLSAASSTLVFKRICFVRLNCLAYSQRYW